MRAINKKIAGSLAPIAPIMGSNGVDEEELKKKLTPEQYKILRGKGTERPFTSPLLNVHEKGMFACAVCGQELFASDAKFDSGTGWPSFNQAIPGAVEFKKDDEHGMSRTEVTCSKCGSHLGHVFNDGPAETTGKRFCINGACLMHKPTDQG
jgi:peptide-methionine (R)-S-oxide reductase